MGEGEVKEKAKKWVFLKNENKVVKVKLNIFVQLSN